MKALRRLLVLGATTVIQFAKPGRASPWLIQLLAWRPRKLAAVALANKMGRIPWAMMVSGELYRRPQPAFTELPGVCQTAARWRSVEPTIGTIRGIQRCCDIAWVFGSRSAHPGPFP